jgi:hypothetical protein
MPRIWALKRLTIDCASGRVFLMARWSGRVISGVEPISSRAPDSFG